MDRRSGIFEDSMRPQAENASGSRPAEQLHPRKGTETLGFLPQVRGEILKRGGIGARERSADAPS